MSREGIYGQTLGAQPIKEVADEDADTIGDADSLGNNEMYDPAVPEGADETRMWKQQQQIMPKQQQFSSDVQDSPR